MHQGVVAIDIYDVCVTVYHLSKTLNRLILLYWPNVALISLILFGILFFLLICTKGFVLVIWILFMCGHFLFVLHLLVVKTGFYIL